MNKIYRVVWNKSTQTWTAVSEYATAQGKSSSRSAVAGSEKKSSKGVRFVYTALVSASLMMLGGQAWAADGNKYPIVGTPIGDSYCYYDNRSQSVVCGKEASVADTYDNKQAKSVAVGWKTKTTGESNVALGVNSAAAKTAATALGASAKALNDYGIAIGFESMANNTWDISIGRDAGGTVNSLGVDGTIPDGRNIAIGDGALKGGKQVNNNTVLGTSAGAGLTGSHNIAIGAHANDGVTVNATIDDKGVTKAGVAITADNTIAIGQRAAASTTSSIAIGNRSKASGSTAVAVGSSAMASSTNGVALGYNAQSKGSHAIAIGGGNVANAAQATQNFGIAIGTLSSSTGAQAIAHGYQASAAAANSIAHGNQASAAALNSIVIGSNASVKAVVATNGKVSDKKGNELEVRRVGETTGNGSVAIGMNSSAYGTNATAVGQASEALGQNSFAGGQDSHATGKSAVAVGDGAISSNDSTTSVGPYSKAIAAGSSAYGFQSNATGDHSTALGSGAQAIATQSTAVGRGSSAQGSNSLALGDRATVMQKGLEAYWQNGAYHTRDSLSVGAIAAGKEAVAKGDGAIAIGSGSQTEFANATGVGKLAKALGYNSSAFGFESMAKGKSSIAIGDKALAGSQDSNSHLPITNFGIAIGVNTNATGETAVALGSNAESKAHRGTALGVLSKAAVNDSVALGAYSIANRDKGEAGADPLSAKQVGADASVWTATHAAVSVGNDAAITDDPRQGATTKAGNFNIPKVTRQITGVAAGTQDTDAVNVAQLKAAGFVLATTADTQAGGVATTSANTSTDNKIVNGETLTLKAGKGVTLNQDGAEVTITTDLSKADKTHYFSVNHDNTLQGVGNNYNNDGATGRNALAAGSHAKATGEESTAIGHDSLAEGKQSVAVGYKAKAKGEHALAIGDVAEAAKWGTAVGYGSRAEGVGSPIAIGTNSQTIGGNSPMAIGDWATADGSGAIAIGSKIGGAHEADKSTFAQGDKAIALGYLTKATQRDAMALGAETSATAESTVAIGKKAQATDSNSISIGRQSGSAGIDLDNKGANNNADITSRTKAGKTNANGLVNVTSIGNEAGSGTINNNYGVNIGYQAGSGGYNSYYGEGVSIGNKAGGVDKTNATVKTAMEAFSAGQGATDNTIITGNTNTAISSRAGVNALGHDNVAIGKDAGGYSSGSSNIAIGRHAGRASKLNTPNNEATRVIDGDVFSNARNTISMGEWANASSDDATAVGRLASASGASSMALGHQATAKPEKSVAIGYNARAVGTETSSISIGENAYNNASGALVIGKDASAKGFADVLTTGASPAKALPYNAIAIGKGANVDTLVGTNGTQERSTDAIAIGTDAKANYASTIAIGYGAKANTKSSATAIGLNSDAQGWKSLAVGVGAVAKQTDSVALGSESVADIGFNQIGADPLNAQTDKNGHAWKSTKAAVSVGNVAGGVTRQITSVAAGTQDTDAVNVAQLRAAGFKLTISESDGVAVDSTEEKVKNGDTVTIDAGKNIKVTQTGSKVSIATKDNVTFNSVEVGNVYIDEANDDIIGLSNTFLGDDNFAADGRAATEEQLNETQDNLVRVLGGNAKNNDGTVSTNNIGGTGKHTIDEAVQFVHDKTATTPLTIEGNKVAPLDPANTNKLVTAGDIANAINNTGFTLTTMTTNDGELGANSTNNQLIKAGDTVTVEADNNIKVTQANGKISVATKNDVKFDSVVAGGTKLDGNGLSFVNNDGTAVTNSPSISKTGINAGNQKITNVADGVIAADSKDAVNGGQLHAVKTTAESKLGAFTVGTDKNATAQGITIDKDKARFDIVGADDGKVITQVDGNKIAVDLTADAKDSLAKADSALQSIQVKANGTDVTTLGKDNNTLDITQGDNITVSNDGGKVKVALNQDVASLNSLTSKTITAGEGTNQVVLDNIGVNVGGKTYISDAGLNANSKKVTNVADGAITADSKDAVNGSQLHTVSTATKNLMGGNATVNTDGTVTALDIGGTNANTIDDAIKTVKTTVKSTDNSIKVTANTADKTNGTVFDISVNAQGLAESAQLPVVYTDGFGNKVYKHTDGKFYDKPNGQGDQIAPGDIVATMQAADGSVVKPTSLTNVAAGANDTDAVNVSQLKGAVTALGGGAQVNLDGSFKAPTYTLTDGDPSLGNTTTYHNVGDALAGLNTAVNQSLSFSGDAGDAFDRKLGSAIKVTGGVTESTKLTDNNIGVVADHGTLAVKLAKDIDLGKDGSVVTGNTTVNNDGITIKVPVNGGTTDVKLTANGLNNGGNKITNVAKGISETDAVNVGQLNEQLTATEKTTTAQAGSDKVTVQGTTTGNNTDYVIDLADSTKNSLAKADSALQSIQVKANGTDVTTLGKDNNTLDITQGDNITVSNDGGKVKVALNQDVTGLNSLTSKTITAGEGTNQVVLDNTGVKVGGKTYISDAGLNANSKKVTNVADGAITATSKDAINGSQLYAVSTATKNLMGGNATVNTDGTVTASNIGGTNANTIDDAIKTVKTTVKSKDNSIKVTANPADTTNGTVFDISVNAQGLAESAQLPVVYTKADGTKVYKVGSKFFDNKEGTGTEIEATNIIASMQNADGTITPTTLANIKAGTKDTDAVNVSQLKGVADTLGGGASINADGTINAPTYNITNPADGGVIKAQNVGDALNALNTAVNNPLTFAGDTGLFNRNLGQTTTIKGGVIDENKLSNSNIGVVAKDGTLDIKLAKDITIDSVTTGNTTVNNEGVTIKAPAGNNTVTDVKLTANGLNNGGNKITNVADGEVVAGSKDAVNGGQLFNIKQDIVTNATNVAKGLSFAGNTGEFNSQLGDKVTVSGGLNDASITSSNTNIRTVAKDGKIDIQLADAPVFTGKVSAKGLDAGNQKITGVLAGDDKTDAVNVEQLSKALANVTVANQSLVQANSPFSYINKAGEQLVRKVAVVNGKSVVTFEKAKDGSIYTGDDITITALNPTDPQTAIPTLISNVKAGINDNDAVNVSQLKKVDAKAIVKTKVVQGDGITVTNKGSAEAPNYEVSLDKDIKDSLTGANNSLQTIKVKANGKNVKELTKDNNELNIKGDSNITVTNDNGEVKVGLADVITVGSPNNATGATNNPIKIDGEKGAITGLTNKDLTATDFAKAGRAATEEQLKAVNDFAVKYDTDPTSGNPNKDSVTFAGTPATPAIKAVDDKFTMAGGTVLNNVASAGDYTQAVNAYKATNAGDLNNAVIDVTNKGLKFAGNVGNEFTAKLGTTVGIKGGMVESTPTSATSGDNVITRTDNYGNINIELAKNAKFDSVITGSTKIDNNGLTFVDNAGKPVANSPSISQTGINAGNQRITGILAGDDKTDAVNVEQLNKALANITVTNQSIVQANSPFSYVNTAGEQLIREVKTVNGKKEVAFKKAKDGTAYTGDDITIAALNPADPQTTLPTTIGNIKAGVQANDAVNVSQLKGMVTALGGGASIQDDGSLKAPEYTIHKTDGQAVKVNNVGDAVQALNNEVTKPFTFIGDNGEKVARKLGENITVKGGATGNLTKNNIGIVANSATGELNVQLAETVNLGQNGSVAMGNTLVNNAGITVGDKVALTNTGLTTGDITVNADGINAGNKAISNVANGVNANDAVNVSQLKAVQDSMKTASVTAGSDAITVSKTTNGNNTDYTIDLANSTKADIAKGVDAKNAVDTKGLTFTADAGKTTAKKLGDSIAITGDKNISTNATVDGVKVSLNENIAVKEVKADTSKIGSVTINNAGINMGDKQITGLASGLNGKTLEDIKADLTAPERNNAATVGDLATVQNNVTNITNNILQNTIGDEHFVELGGKLTEEGKLALKTYDVSGQEGTTNNTIISAIKNINEGGIKYFHTNDGTNKPGGTKDLNSEDSSASGAYATAIGYQADAQGNLSIAFGKGAKALAERTISIGTGNIVSGEGSGAIGDPSIINGANSYSVGNNNTVATDSTFVLGNNVTQTLANSVILGDGSAATEVHTIAKGGNYTYAGANDANVAGVNNVVGVVSVGTQGDAQKPSETRQIQNVAAGVVSANSTDAINGSQLYDTHQAIGNINHRIGDIEDKANAGVSSAMAMASLPQAYIPGKSMLTGGVATYNGEGAVAVGLSKLSDNGRWVLKMSGSADTKGNAGASIGAGFHF